MQTLDITASSKGKINTDTTFEFSTEEKIIRMRKGPNVPATEITATELLDMITFVSSCSQMFFKTNKHVSSRKLLRSLVNQDTQPEVKITQTKTIDTKIIDTKKDKIITTETVSQKQNNKTVEKLVHVPVVPKTDVVFTKSELYYLNGSTNRVRIVDFFRANAGVPQTIKDITEKTGISKKSVLYIMIGTTQPENSMVANCPNISTRKVKSKVNNRFQYEFTWIKSVPKNKHQQ